MQTYFREFSSNTLAASGNQLFFQHKDAAGEGVVFYRLFSGGTWRYSFLFSNIMDSTYGDGKISQCNLLCPPWRILEAKVAVCDEIAPEKLSFCTALTFDGEKSKMALPGLSFHSDPVRLSARAGQYLALDLRFEGTRIPYYEETIISHFVRQDGAWLPSQKMPVPGLVACDRPVKRHIGFFGDSITAGIGTPKDAYAHWNAHLAELLGPENAYWNLGLGYGRAGDGASLGAWLNKAKENDLVFLCFGVNDICQGSSAEKLKADLMKIVAELKKAGVRVIWQTVPPFDYPPEKLDIWQEVNDFIMSRKQDENLLIFDDCAILSDPEKPEHDPYGGHPDEEGCKLWAEALYRAAKSWI